MYNFAESLNSQDLLTTTGTSISLSISIYIFIHLLIINIKSFKISNQTDTYAARLRFLYHFADEIKNLFFFHGNK